MVLDMEDDVGDSDGDDDGGDDGGNAGHDDGVGDVDGGGDGDDDAGGDGVGDSDGDDYGVGIGLTAVTTYDDEYDDTLGFCTKSAANLDLGSQANHWATDSFLLKYLAQNQHGNSSRIAWLSNGLESSFISVRSRAWPSLQNRCVMSSEHLRRRLGSALWRIRSQMQPT